MRFPPATHPVLGARPPGRSQCAICDGPVKCCRAACAIGGLRRRHGDRVGTCVASGLRRAPRGRREVRVCRIRLRRAGEVSRSACDDRRVTTTAPGSFAATALERLRTLTADDRSRFRPGQLEAIEDVVVGSRPRVVRAAHRVGKVGRVLRRDRAAARGRRGTDVDHQSAAGVDAQPDRRGAAAGAARAHGQ